MRAEAIVLVLLLTVPSFAMAAPLTMLITRSSERPGWFGESFTLVNSTEIKVVVADDSSSEIVGHMIALYDDAGVLLRGTSFFSIGGQIVEVAASNGDVGVTNAGAPGLVTAGYFSRSVTWTCDAACNPSRKFKLAVSAGGDLDWWAFGLYTRGGNRTGSVTNGADAFAATTREFNGTVVHLNTPSRGVHMATEVTLDAHVDDRMLATFVKPSDTDPRRMGLERIGGSESACPCLGEFAAGDYKFHYDDMDREGVEGYLTWADVRLPS